MRRTVHLAVGVVAAAWAAAVALSTTPARLNAAELCVPPGPVQGRCVPVAEYSGPCAPYTSQLPSFGYAGIYVFNFRTLNTTDDSVRNVASGPRTLGNGVIGDECFRNLDAMICTLGFLPCNNVTYTNATSGQLVTEPLPTLPCKSFCTNMWSNVCNVAFALYYSQYISTPSNVNASLLPFCGPNGGSFTAAPAPADRFGAGRILPTYSFYPNGFKGELLFPDSGTWVLGNGTAVNVGCYPVTPNPTKVDFGDFKTVAGSEDLAVCRRPTVKSPTSNDCVLECPIPLWNQTEFDAIQWVYAAPGLLGVALCFLVLLDAMFVILEHTGGCNVRRFAKLYLGFRTQAPSSTQGGAGAGVGSHTNNPEDVKSMSSPPPAGKSGGTGGGGAGGQRSQKLRASTLYALVGAVLCIVYFFIGPLGVIVRGRQMSCSTTNKTTLTFGDINTGKADLSGAYCKAQRASPFLLQWIFNLILYATVEMLLASSMKARRSAGAVWRRAVHAVLVSYCVFVPALCLGLALGLDKMSTDFGTSVEQLMRSTAICTVRLDRGAEIVLIFLPFIITGFAISIISLYVFIVLRSAHQKSAAIKGTQSSTDVALYHLIIRLALLGVFTLMLFIVQMVTTGVVQIQLGNFSAVFGEWFRCVSLGTQCGNCDKEEAAYLAARPSPAAIAVQAASESFIIVLFGGFFVLQAFARIRRDYADGKLGAQFKRVFGYGGTGTGHGTSAAEGGDQVGKLRVAPNAGQQDSSAVEGTAVMSHFAFGEVEERPAAPAAGGGGGGGSGFGKGW